LFSIHGIFDDRWNEFTSSLLPDSFVRWGLCGGAVDRRPAGRGGKEKRARLAVDILSFTKAATEVATY